MAKDKGLETGGYGREQTGEDGRRREDWGNPHGRREEVCSCIDKGVFLERSVCLSVGRQFLRMVSNERSGSLLLSRLEISASQAFTWMSAEPLSRV